MEVFPADINRWLELMWDGVVVHYHEIALKGGNRRLFMGALHRNLQRVLAPFDVAIQPHFDRFIITPPRENFAEVLCACAQVFGVAYTAPIRFLPCDPGALAFAAVQTYRALSNGNETFAIRVRRVAKAFPFTSQDLESLIGREVVAKTGAPVNLDQPDILLSFRIYDDGAYLVGPKVPGVGGLPVGTTGKVVTLLSGGIDSPVAAWLIMRRGCHTDFVHFHAFPDAPGQGSKIVRLVEALIKPQGMRALLLLVPYVTFQMATLAVPPRLELVLFRRFMVRVATHLARTYGYQALVSGDNLGQVASQTLENLALMDDATNLPMFRPLLSYDKQEIIALAQRIGTYELSIQPYKDCCSLIARHPETKANLGAIRAVEAQMPIEDMVEETLSKLVVLELNGH